MAFDKELVKGTLPLLVLQLVAEGVERFAQAEFLRTLECERVQGYHFYQPVSAEEVVGFGGFGLFAAAAA